MRSALLGLLLLHLGALTVTTDQQVKARSELGTQIRVFLRFLNYVMKHQSKSEILELKDIVEILTLPQHFWKKSYRTFSLEKQGLTCIACNLVTNSVIHMRREGKSQEDIAEFVITYCSLLQIQTERVCRGFVELNIPILTYIVDNVPELSAETFCGILLQSDDKDSCPYEDERFEWSIDIPPKPAFKTQNSQKLVQTGESFKILHLSDIHYDPAYEAFGLADCNEPTCCRIGQAERGTVIKGGVYNNQEYKERIQADKTKDSKNERSEAGYWGDYRSCDTPWWAVEDGIDFITENHNSFEYVYYTGDTIDHGVWETTEELITESIIKTTDKLKEAFGNTPVYQVIGNHESQPVNQFAPTEIMEEKLSTSWMYSLLWEQWKQWLPAEAEETLKKGGYYTVLPQKGLRVIVLNSNLCYRYNWWIHYNPEYPSEQLTWMIKVLLLAEANNEKVHILSHIPAGVADCVAVYTREYKKIIERFADIITAEFNGHTHNDEFKVFYTKESGQPILTAWNGGSLTAYTDVNPNYRIYEVDSSTYEILNMETWVYNLTEANQTPYQRPRWYLEYTFREKYNVSSLSPQDMDALLERLVTVDQDLLVNDYHHFRGKSSDPFVNRPCDDTCVKDNLNYLLVTELYDNTKYHEMNRKYLNSKSKLKVHN